MSGSDHELAVSNLWRLYRELLRRRIRQRAELDHRRLSARLA
jgi:hypothetical protein